MKIIASQIWLLIILLFEEILCMILYFKKLKVIPCINKDSLKLLLQVASFGLIPMINLLLNSLNYKIDVVMLKQQLTYTSVTIYTIAVTLAEGVWAIPNAVRDVLVSKLSNGKKEDEVCKIIRFSNSIIFLTQVFLLISGPWIISFLYGDNYLQSYKILSIAMCGSYGMNYVKMITAYHVVNGKNKTNLFIMGITAVVNIMINFLLIPEYGIYGAAIASIISYNLGGILMIFFFKKETNISYRNIFFISKKDLLDLNLFVKLKDTF